MPAALTACSPAPAASPPITGIARALDGDSLEVSGKQVRLFGVDAPEYDQSCKRNGQTWACGEEAARRLSQLVTGKQVFCEPVSTDEYERAVARCRTMGTDVNAAMVESGYAIAYRHYSADYVPAEQRAKEAKRGLWSGTFTSPTDWRHAQKQNERAASVRVPRQTARSGAPSNGCTIKGNQGSNGWIYHLPGMPYYAQTKAEQMFCSEAEARAAGYRRAKVR